MESLKVAVAGASGRMGRVLIETVLGSGDLHLAAALEQKGHPHVGTATGQMTGSQPIVKVSDDVEASLNGCDLIVDFTRPEGTLTHIGACRKLGVKMVRLCLSVRFFASSMVVVPMSRAIESPSATNDAANAPMACLASTAWVALSA